MEAAASDPRAKRRERKVRVDLTLCRYEVVRKVVRARGWVAVSDDRDARAVAACNLHWVDVPEVQGKFSALLPYQKLNHLPGMSNLARKSRLARNLERLRKLFPDEYAFFPRTWILPFDLHEFQQQFNADGESARPFIVKPDHSCQGRGVFLTRQLKEAAPPSGDLMVAQQYVSRPLLIEGKKFDLRIYVLVASVDPLRVYLFQDGLVRMCTAAYVPPNDHNLEQRFMHLTNYAVNKRAANFERNQGGADDGHGSKRSLRWFFSWLRATLAADAGGAAPAERADRLWQQIGDICLKAVLTVQPVLAQEYRSTFARYLRHAYSAGPTPSASAGPTPSASAGARPASARPASASASASRDSCCFALLGMDVLVDESLKPWLLEVNHLPSFGCDSPLDWDIKERLISQTFDLLGLSPGDKDRYDEAQARSTRRRLYGAGAADNQLADLPPIRGRPPRQQPEADAGDADAGDAARPWWPLGPDALCAALERFYARVSPARAADVESIAAKYAARQDALERHLARKYGRGLAAFITNDGPSSAIAKAAASALAPTAADCEPAREPLDGVGEGEHKRERGCEQADEQADGQADGQADEQTDEQLVDFVRVYPPAGDAPCARKYRAMLEASQSHMSELQMRFSAPLQHRRAADDDGGGGAAGALPPIAGAARREMQLGRDCFGFSGTDKARWLLADAGDKRAAAVPGPQQVAAAHRLMLGHSSQKTAIKPPTPPGRTPKARQESVDYGLQYRDRLATLKHKPTIAMAQISFGCFD